MGKIVRTEAERITKDGVLQARRIKIDDGFLRAFDLTSIHDRVRNLCPSMTSLMRSFSTTARQRREMLQVPASEKGRKAYHQRAERKEIVSHPPARSVPRVYQRIHTENRDLFSEPARRKKSEQQFDKTCTWSIPVRQRSKTPAHLCPLQVRDLQQLPHHCR